MNTKQTSKRTRTHTHKQHNGGQSMGLPFHSEFVVILNKPQLNQPSIL